MSTAGIPNTFLPHVFSPASTPAHEIYRLAIFVIVICAGIFVLVTSVGVYAVAKFRHRAGDRGREPMQIFGSLQLELAWTVVPLLIVVVLFLTTARVIHAVEDARAPANALQVTVIGHQWWWEFRYPQYGVVTANELWVPESIPEQPQPTYLTLLSADADHSFWVPELAGKTDLIPNQVNHTWIEPQRSGLYLGQCAFYCGTQHAHMLLRVMVEPRAAFEQWIRQQQQPATETAAAAAGRRVFLSNACVDCHTVRGTAAHGSFGPDLTHLMSRATIASGMLPNTPANLRRWVADPNAIKPGCRMPTMHLSPQKLDQVTAYLETLR